MYEATTVFQRTRTQKMLGGMAAAASPIYVYRYVCNVVMLMMFVVMWDV